MSYTGAVPDTIRAADWRDIAACRLDDPEAWFATEDTTAGKAGVRHAIAVCARCPVLDACRQWALDTRQQHGIWGGLTERERRAIWRRRGVVLPEPTDDDPRPRTHQSVYEDRSVPLDGGHVGWSGAVPVKIGGLPHTPSQIAFQVDRGRPPVGPVLRTCGRDGCVLAGHLRDGQERELLKQQADLKAVAV